MKNKYITTGSGIRLTPFLKTGILSQEGFKCKNEWEAAMTETDKQNYVIWKEAREIYNAYAKFKSDKTLFDIAFEISNNRDVWGLEEVNVLKHTSAQIKDLDARHAERRRILDLAQQILDAKNA